MARRAKSLRTPAQLAIFRQNEVTAIRAVLGSISVDLDELRQELRSEPDDTRYSIMHREKLKGIELMAKDLQRRVHETLVDLRVHRKLTSTLG